MNHNNLIPTIQQITLPPVDCPNCSTRALAALSTLELLPQSILSLEQRRPNTQAQGVAKATEHRVLCFACGYRAHWRLNKTGMDYETTWESQETTRPYGGLVAGQQAP